MIASSVLTVAPSLFAPPAAPVLPAAAQWLSSALLGSVAVSLCVLAVAFVGFALMSGRLAVREGVRVALGCFVVLGAPAIALGLESVTDGTVAPAPAQVEQPAPAPTFAPPGP